MPVSQAWFAGVVVGPRRRRVESLKASEREVLSLDLDRAGGVLVCVDSEGIERHYPISRCETYELAARHDVGGVEQ